MARPAGPRLTVHVADLRRRLGERRVVDVDVVLPELTVVASRTAPTPVIGRLIVESIERGVSVTGSVTFDWVGDCRRCLEPVAGSEVVDVDEIFQVGAPDDSEILELDGDSIDLVPVVRDAVLLSLPLAPLCRDGCTGPDPDRYPAMAAGDLATDDDDESRPPALADPRWAALEGLEMDESDD